MRRTLGNIFGRVTAPLLVAVLVAGGLALQAPPADVAEAQPVAAITGQTHYLPWDAQQFYDLLIGQQATSTGSIQSPIRLITSFVSAVDGNTVAIDHWEDGYDADPIGSPGATTEILVLNEGDPQLLDNFVDLSQLGDPGYITYDGGDKLVSTGAIVVNMGGWPSNATTLHAGAVVVREVNSFGYEFVSPVGEDTTYGGTESALSTLWEYVGLVIVASQDDTTVTLDDGTQVTLDEGDSHHVNGGVNLGDSVTADKPVGVFLATGDNGASYEGRLFGLLPTEAWFDGYITPVGSRNQTDEATRVFLFNPGASTISVSWESSGGTTGSVSVPAGGQGNVKLPTNQGMRFTSPGNPFYALQAITTPESGATDRSSAFNWGLALTPSRALTPMVVVGYGPGSSNFTENDSPVWVAAQADTTLLIDLDADPATGSQIDADGNHYDFSCAVSELTPVLIKDIGGTSCSTISAFTNSVSGSGDADMTGARIYSDDGTSIVAAWGQVPGLNSIQPAIDMGTSVLPFPVIDLQKDAEIVGDDGDGLALPGDTIHYTIQAINRGIAPIDDLTLTDELPEHVSYVPGTTLADGNPVADDPTGTPFPLDDGILLPPAIDVGQTRIVTFDVVIDDPLPTDVTEFVNVATLATDYGTYSDIATTPTAPTGSIGDRVWNDDDGDGVQDGGEGGLVGVTVELRNGAGDVLATTTTGADGAYSFGDVYPGTYSVRVDPTSLPAGQAPTYDLDGVGSAHQASVTLAAGQDRTDADFGYTTSTITLAKTVYLGHDGGSTCPGGELATGEPGDDITYCFRVTNTGAVALVGVGVDDPDLAIDESAMSLESGNPALLAAGQSVVWSYETQIDGDLVNTAEAEAFISLGGVRRTATDTAEVNEIGPSIDIQKTVYRGHDGGASCGTGVEALQVRAGGDLTYCFVVTNTGETNLAAIDVTDADLGLDSGDLTHALLTPGESVTLHAEVQADGDLLNTASVTGTSPAGAQPSDSDTAEVDEIDPALTVDKTIYAGHDSGASCAGDESVTTLDGDPVSWCFLVTNTGDVDLTDITLDDLPLLADETDLTVVSGSLATLPVGGTITLYLQGNASGDLANTVTATGEPPVGADVTDDDTASLEVVDPSITLEKTVYAGHDGGSGCDGGELVTGLSGDDVTYCFTITNAAGQGPLTNVQLADLDLDDSGLTLLSGDVSPLVDGHSATFYLESTIDGDLVNTGSVTATPPAGPDVSDEDTAEVDEVNAGIALVKSVYLGHSSGAGCAGAGESIADEHGRPVTWCFTVTNGGDATLTDVQLDDGDLGIDQTDLTVLSGSLASLAPGGSVVLYLEGSIDGDLTNTATASATPPVGPDPTDEDSASVDELVPDYTIEKTVYLGHDGGVGCAGADRVAARAGAPVTWCVEVVNTGQTVLDIEVTDPDVGLDQTVDDLAPGGHAMLFVEGTVDGDLVNTASGTGIPPHGPPIPKEDIAEVDEVHPSISVLKTVYGGHDAGVGCPGGDTYADEAGRPVTWCFTVVNTGDTDLTSVSVDDAALGIDESDLSVLSGSLALIPAGGSLTLYFEGTLDGPLVNTATATGIPPVGPDVSDEDDASVELLEGSIQIEKSVYAGHDDGASCEGGELVVGQSGDEVTWCFLVTNTGGVPLDATVDDPDVGFTDTIDDLAPGASTTLWFEGAIDGDLVNTATATGVPPHGPPVEHEDTAEVDEIDPSIQVEKTVYLGHDDGAGCAGVESVEAEVDDEVTWCFTITNTGDVDLVDIDLADPVLGVDQGDVTLLSGSLATLAPDATIVAYLEGTVDGDIDNTVTAGGVAPDDSRQTDDDTAAVTVVAPQIGIAKTIIEGPTGNGDGTYTLTYRLRVANAGETRLDAVQVTDDLTETFGEAQSFQVDEVVSADLTVSDAYDGRPTGSIELLTGTDVLEVGQRGDIEVTVTVDPGADLGPYENIAHTTGTSPGGHEVEDYSDSGNDADPTAPNPDEPGDTGGTDDPVPVEFPAIDLTVVKTVGDVRIDGSLAVVDWRMVVTNGGPGDDGGPITVTDDLDERLSFVSATGDGWDCEATGQRVTCVWNAPLAAGDSTTEIQLLTEMDAPIAGEVTNGAHVASTGSESRTDNNDDAAVVSAGDEEASPTGTLPRTGAAIGTLVLLALGLVLGGRLLQRRGARAVA